MSLDVNNFFGTYTPRLDDKFRLFLPAKFRPRLERGVVLMRGQEHCVFGWTPEAYSAFADRMRNMPFTNRESRNFVRMVSAGTEEVVPDKQGRISIPPVLRGWASLEREVTVIGAMDRIEIWDSVAWTEFVESQEEAFADMSDEVMPILD
ncbi:MAG: division/cell wall cluster transcriptional repressor MraZ [Aeromicrobium sp.]